ncbi:universal stress protein [Rhodoplanes sp. TEM]|uniref:Universal stress protein n=1 Tax=Rhodoplanes tepidamans TaxID=200616 RepID=A0ABT5JIN1_RHOTP|nr:MULTISPECIES: universal stress protein [Rhodoplanes]MDC7789585.1 universal stress protein [Rhodoplanes tepidamans]MDC7986631.1 universal stress protein [Rhodoplanes sp. TEM]MDQ0357271.1 nucleotide-binding universal stress UspA family protein [Rhodoplanes tepidamans]
MIKDIVVNLALVGDHDPAAAFAISIARIFGAHVTGVVFVYDPVISPSIMDGVSAEWIDAQRDESRTMAQAAIERFERAAQLAGIQAGHRIIEATLGGATDMFGRIARRFDLVVVGQREPDRMSPADLFAEGALFESGRPVVMVPYIQKQGLALDRVLMCWDGSRTAARAMGDAMPFLTRARQVDVVIVATGRSKSDEVPGADVGHHLARHGIKVDVKRIVAEDVDVPNTILSYAADVSADLIVMGGYGHSRLREFVLGGATRGILASMTVPVLMAH